MKNIKGRIGSFGKMILVFPEAFLAKLTKPKSRVSFNNRSTDVAKFFVMLPLLMIFVGLFIDFFKNFSKTTNTTNTFFLEHFVLYLCLFLFFILFLLKLQFFFVNNSSYFDFLSECTLREKKETTLFDDENEQNVSEVVIIMFPEHQKENGDKKNEISTKETMDILKTYRFRGKKGIVILKKGKAESRKNVDNISVEKIYANDDIEKFSQKARYRIKKVELLKETAIFTLWNMEYKKESRRLLVTVEGNIAEDVLEELKAKAVVQEELNSLLN